MEQIPAIDDQSSAADGPSLPALLALCGSLLPGGEVPPPEANLFELGADSMTVSALTAEAAARWGVELDPAEVFLADDLAAVYVLLVPPTSRPRA